MDPETAPPGEPPRRRRPLLSSAEPSVPGWGNRDGRQVGRQEDADGSGEVDPLGAEAAVVRAE